MLGFRKAADQLRRDWELNPDELPFAPSVRPGDLIRLVLDGLHHDEIAASALQAQIRSSEQAARSLDAARAERKYKFIFQPSMRELSIRSAAHITRPSEDRDRVESPLKRPRDGANGATSDGMGRPPAPKRARKSTATELKERENLATANGILHTDVETPTRPDEDETMLDDGPGPLVSTLENGVSNEVQTEFDHFIQPKELTAIEREVTGLGSVITHSKWSPNNAEDLLFVGGDHTAHLWRFPYRDKMEKVEEIRLDIPVEGPHIVSSYLWDYRGDELLLSYDRNDRTGPFGLVSYNRDATRTELENSHQRASRCLALRQNPITHMVIAFSSTLDHQNDVDRSGCVQIWHEDFWMRKSPVASSTFPQLVRNGDWIDHTLFAVSCGQNVELFMCVPQDWNQTHAPSVNDVRSASALQVRRVRPDLLGPGYVWDMVRHIPDTDKIICLSTEVMAVGWADIRTCETQSLVWDQGRDGQINCIGVQKSRRTIATVRGEFQQSNGGDLTDQAAHESCAFAILTDAGKIFVYDINASGTSLKEGNYWVPAMRQYDIGPFPALAVAFSHNGRFLAIGSLEKVYIYDLSLDGDGGREHVAFWTGEVQISANGHEDDRNGFHSPGKDEEQNEHCLDWNKDDTRLMYAMDRRVSNIATSPDRERSNAGQIALFDMLELMGGNTSRIDS